MNKDLKINSWERISFLTSAWVNESRKRLSAYAISVELNPTLTQTAAMKDVIYSSFNAANVPGNSRVVVLLNARISFYFRILCKKTLEKEKHKGEWFSRKDALPTSDTKPTSLAKLEL